MKPKSSRLQPRSRQPSQIPQPPSLTITTPIKKRLRYISIRMVLIVPFAIQTFATVGLIGYLSYRNGQQAVNDLVIQLSSQVTQQINLHLDNYLNTPHLLHQITANAIANGNLDLGNELQMQRQFFADIQLSDAVDYIYVGDRDGHFLGVQRYLDGQIVVKSRSDASQPNREIYELDSQGYRQTLIKSSEYDPRSRPWYQATITTRKQTWSPIFHSADLGVLQITPTTPIYAPDGEFRGVMGTNLILSQISDFLRDLDIGKTGEAFIIERSGEIVASSTSEKPFILTENDPEPQRLNALSSTEAVIRQTMQELSAREKTLSFISEPLYFSYNLDGKTQLIQVTPLSNVSGLNWLIVVAVPEADFMEQIAASSRSTVRLCLMALLISTLIGIFTSRWITQPILRLNLAAQDLAQGEWDRLVTDINRGDEVGQLAQAFDSMAQQLRQSFEILETQRNSFARFVPLEYLEFLRKDNIVNVNLGDHVSKEMAIMFSDIRGFTTLSEQMTPQANFDFVNAYLQAVNPVIRDRKGFIIKYLGDGLMAAFPESPDDAVQAAIATFNRVREFNQTNSQPIQIGMGIHVGQIMVGMIGDENRMQGDAISDNVNLTARLEGLTKYYGVLLLISEQVVLKLRDRTAYNLRFIDRVIVKGRIEPIDIYEVLDAETTEILTLKQKTQPQFETSIAAYQKGDLT
ncbi:MAG: adenylate/guanylate cyclase domain-containing protein, partial [Jaaginema sp. PMC 1079.18]|nr:adenylate/guanylate cyclase domain-containing protein [Jaaginema sp. PMC 1079.18]